MVIWISVSLLLLFILFITSKEHIASCGPAIVVEG